MSDHNVVQHNKDRYVAIELAGVMSEYLVMPCQSLEGRMRDTLRRYDSRIKAMIQAHQGVLENPPAEQHQGEPVGALLIEEYFDNREVGEVDVQLNSKVCEQLAEKYPGQSLPLYTHADPGEVERKLAERDELLEEAYRDGWNDGQEAIEQRYQSTPRSSTEGWEKFKADNLSASAEPSTPVERKP